MNPTDFAVGTPWAISPRHFDNLVANYVEYMKSPVDAIQALTINLSDGDDLGYDIVDGVAVIGINGPISKSQGLFSFLFGGTSYAEIASAFSGAVANPDVGAIVFDIDSPGGTVAGVEAVGDLIFSGRGDKPIVSFANGMMASAAYWLGSAAETVVGGKTSEVGSIGVLMIHEDVSKMDSDMGIKVTYLTAGKYKAMGNSHEPLGDEAKQMFQEELNQIYSVFVDTVARNRDEEHETVLTEQADGRVFIGQQAKDRGLIDQIGTLALAVDLARSSIGNQTIRVGGKTMELKIETTGDLVTNFPNLVDQIISDTKAMLDIETKIAEAVQGENERLLNLVDTFLGKEKADAFRALVSSGVTTEQYQAIAGLQNSTDEDGPVTMKQMLAAIKKAGAENVGTGGDDLDSGKDYMTLVEAHMKDNGVSKAQAMRAITAKFPDKHEEYIRSVNQSR